MENKLRYLYIDGDNIGLRIEESFLNNNEEELTIINESVIQIIDQITKYLISNNQKIIFSGADGVICKGKGLDDIQILTMIRATIKDITFSIGSGFSLRDAYMALRYAKSINKDVAVRYEKSKFIIIGKQEKHFKV
jgi:minimal CRISPR polymerase domain